METMLCLVFVLLACSTHSLETDTGSDDVVDWVPRARVERDYGSNLGGPLAASGLPASIGAETGPPAVDATIINPCLGSGHVNLSLLSDASTACGFQMHAQQRLTRLGDPNNKPLGLAKCDSVQACQQECDKRGCNYLTLAGLTAPYSAHFYKVANVPNSGGDFVASEMFDSLYKSCSAMQRKRTHRQTNLPAPRPLPPDSMNPQPITTGQPQTQPPHSGEHSPKTPKMATPPTTPLFRGTTPSKPSSPTPVSRRPQKSADKSGPKSKEDRPRDRDHSNGSSPSHFEYFNSHYKKTYNSDEERAQRSRNFDDNVQLMDKLNRDPENNRGKDDALCGLNPFADEDRQTFRKKFGGTVINEKEDSSVSVQLQGDDLRDIPMLVKTKVDWREKKVVPPVRYQGTCGACFAFASADLVAVQNAIERNFLWRRTSSSIGSEEVYPLSPQYLIDCSPPGASMGCDGGRPIKVLEAVAADLKSGGIPLEACQPYQGSQSGSCPNGVSCCQRKKIQKAKMIDISGQNEKDIMGALLNSGPVLAIVNINEIWQFYNGSGIIKSHQCNPNDRNHAVTIVGHDYSGPTHYYIVKNSWSKSWGLDGYAKLEAGTNACGVAKNVITACVRDCQSFLKDISSILRRSHLGN